MKHILIILACLAAATSPAASASFDCSKAATAVEKAICANAELSALDEMLAQYYRAAGRTLPGAQECLRTDQNTWLSQVRNRCTNDACLKDAYLNRLSELDKVQPARRQGEPLPLPVRPFLISIIPPTSEKPAPAESDPARAAPLNVTGSLSEVGGAFLLTTSDRRTYALMNWYLDQAVLDQLMAAIATPGTRFSVRGFAGRNSASGQNYVEPRRCIYVHQLPQR